MVYIYGLYHPITNELRYIGKANNPEKRLKSHMRDCRRRTTPLYCWIKTLPALPTIAILQEVESDWQTAEKQLIAQYREEGARLLNVAEGGDEPFCSVEQRAINGKAVSDLIHADPRKKKIWLLKKKMGDNLKWLKKHNLAETHNRVVDKCRAYAVRFPNLVPGWANLQHI